MASVAELIKSSTRRDTLVLDGFMYVRNVVKGARIYWECIEKRPYQCFGRAVTMGDKTYCSREHTHPPDLAKIELRKAEEMCRDRAIATDSHASTIITSVVEMLPPTSNPYITTTNLMKTIRRARKTAMMRVNATRRKTASSVKTDLTRKSSAGKSKSRRSVGALLDAFSSPPVADESGSLVVLSDASPEATDFKPSNFLDMRAEVSSQLSSVLTKNESNDSLSMTEACCESLTVNNTAESDVSAEQWDTITGIVSGSAQRAQIRDCHDRKSPTDDDVLREFMAIHEANNVASSSSTMRMPEVESWRGTNVLTVRRQPLTSDSNLKRRLSSVHAGSSGGDPQLLRIQGGRCSNNIASIRLDTLLDGTDMQERSFLVCESGLKDSSQCLPSLNSLSANVACKMSSHCQSRKRKSGPESVILSSSPFRPSLGSIPITRNVKYIDSGLTLSLIAPDLDSTSNERFVIFSTERCLGMLEWYEWAVDVDLHALPDVFVYGQLLTIYARIEGRNMQCAWILLSSRDIELCTRALKALQSKEKILNPKVIFTDYDRFLLMALEKAFPSAQIKGSFEHLRRRLIEEAERNRLQQLCPCYVTLIERLKLLLALAFVPSNWTIFAFQELEEKLDLPLEAQPVVDFFEDTFIGRPCRGGRRSPVFSNRIWNVHKQLMDTTYPLTAPFEVWPQRLWGRKRCASCRLTISDFETNLKEEHATTMREYEQLVSGDFVLSESVDQLRRRNTTMKGLIGNFRKTDMMNCLSEIAAEIP